MKVLLKRNWFTPFGRYKKSATKKGPPVEIPESLRKRLPSDAVIVNDEGAILTYEDEPMTLAKAAMAQGLDPGRASKEAEMRVHEGVEGTVRQSTVDKVRANAVAFQKELDAENAPPEKSKIPGPSTSKSEAKRLANAAEVKAHLKMKGK